MRFQVEEGVVFRNTVEIHCSSFPRFEERLSALKFELERNPYEVGRCYNRETQRYAARLSVGTLEWTVDLHYKIGEGNKVILIGIEP